MNSLDIIFISISSMLTVFLVLTALALMMRLIERLFPYKEKEEDVAVYSAIASVHSALYPGAKITKIEEEK